MEGMPLIEGKSFAKFQQINFLLKHEKKNMPSRVLSARNKVTRESVLQTEVLNKGAHRVLSASQTEITERNSTSAAQSLTEEGSYTSPKVQKCKF